MRGPEWWEMNVDDDETLFVRLDEIVAIARQRRKLTITLRNNPSCILIEYPTDHQALDGLLMLAKAMP